MNKITKILIGVLALGVFVWLAFGFFEIQSIFTDNEVEEEIPEAVLNLISQSENASEGGSSQILVKSSFVQGDSTYSISGSAFLIRVEGKLNLTFTDFEVTNGPDLCVYAVKADSTENTVVKETVGNDGFINLGLLKGNIGDQNYVIETEFDPNEYQVISIWCRRFGRNFGSVFLGGE